MEGNIQSLGYLETDLNPSCATFVGSVNIRLLGKLLLG
ncbi:MAG: hypothetical protein BWY42_00338 [Candidatus Omnitrophica bacterium ADurb.Bin277]|nr:MAG: hypothetical protein BWY42_00338 [Candidatus Omnitrophica bacterium ADurb.Bin277]